MVTNKRILLIDAEERTRQALRIYLEKNCFGVEETPLGKKGLQKAYNGNFHVIVLDVNLPDADGFTLCRFLQETTDASVMILTAEDSEEMRIQGLEAGSDAYMAKPFNPTGVVLYIKAILSRIKAQKERYHTASSDHLIQLPGLTIDMDARQVTVHHQEIYLRPKEYNLLQCLAASPGAVYSREALLEEVWGYQTFGKGLKTVDPHIKRLRDKICSVSQQTSEMIVTVRGKGYKLETTHAYFSNDEESETTL